MSGIGGVVAAVLTAAVTVIGMLLTRRSSKDQNAVTGYQALTSSYEIRLRAVEAQQAEQQRLIQAHREWDDEVRHALYEAGIRVPVPPPL